MLKILAMLALLAAIIFAVCGAIWFITNLFRPTLTSKKEDSFKEFFDDTDEFV